MTTPWTERPTRAWSSPPRRPPWTTPLARAADTLTAQGYTLTVTALEDGRVQASLTDAGGNAADDALTAAMETEGFAAAGDGWYTYEEDMDS